MLRNRINTPEIFLKYGDLDLITASYKCNYFFKKNGALVCLGYHEH